MDQDTTLNKNRIIILVAIFFIVFFIGSSLFSKKSSKLQEIKVVLDYSETLQKIEAKSFYVYDILNQKALFSKDEYLGLPLASITKLMSGFIILDMLPRTTIVTINMKDILQEGDSGLVVGEKWKLKPLLDFSLISSSNDGIHALSRTLDEYEQTNNKETVQLMNDGAEKIGLKNTTFINVTGLDIDSFVSGAYSSSRDVAILLENILRSDPSVITNTKNQSASFVSESGIHHVVTNTNISINDIPDIIASKTGFTDLAGGNLAVIFDAGFSHPVAIVVLGSSEKGRFTDVENLVRISLEKLSNSD